MKNKKIYIGVPYGHEDEKVMKERFDIVTTITAKLIKHGYNVISPITYGVTLIQYEEMPHNYDFWEKFCINHLKDSKLFIHLKLDGWEKSEGLKGEYEYAKENDITILDLDYININDIFYEILLYLDSKENKKTEDIKLISYMILFDVPNAFGTVYKKDDAYSLTEQYEKLPNVEKCIVDDIGIKVIYYIHKD